MPQYLYYIRPPHQNLLYLLKAADAALGGNTGFAEAVVWLWLYILALYNGLLQWLYIAALYSGPLYYKYLPRAQHLQLGERVRQRATRLLQKKIQKKFKICQYTLNCAAVP